MTRRTSLSRSMGILLFSLLPVYGYADVTFIRESIVQAGVDARSTRLMDLNSDGFPELLFLAESQGVMSVLWNDSWLIDGETFSFDRRTIQRVGQQPTEIGIGDLNGDGRDDLAIASREDNVVVVFLVDDSGNMVESARLKTGDGPYDVLIADLDGDGNNDIVVGERVDDAVSVFMSHGDGRYFDRYRFGTVEDTRQITLGDFNGNGHLDLAVAGLESLQIFTNPGNGRFRRVQTLNLEERLQALVSGDFNRDGFDDLAVTGLETSVLTILLSAGEKLFSTKVDDGRLESFPLPYLPNVLLVGDANNNGISDLIVGGRSASSFHVMEGTGAGGMIPHLYTSSYSGVSSFALGDIDQDGRTDLVVTSRDSSEAELFRGMGQQPYDVSTDLRLRGLLDQMALLNSDGHSSRMIVADVRNSVLHVLHIDNDYWAALAQITADFTPSKIRTHPVGSDFHVFYSATGGEKIGRLAVTESSRAIQLPAIQVDGGFTAWAPGSYRSPGSAELVIIDANKSAALRSLDVEGDEEVHRIDLGFQPFLAASADLDGNGLSEAVLVGKEIVVLAFRSGNLEVVQRFDNPLMPQSLRLLNTDDNESPDLVLLDPQSRQLAILRNDLGLFQTSPELITFEQRPVDVAAPRIDGNIALAVAVTDRKHALLFERTETNEYRYRNRWEFSTRPTNLLSLPLEEDTQPLLASFGELDYIVRLTKSANAAPETSDLAFKYDRGELFSAYLDAADEDGDALNFSITSFPEAGSLILVDARTGRFTFKADKTTPDVVQFRYRAHDGKESSAEATVRLESEEGGGGSGDALLILVVLALFGGRSSAAWRV